MAFNFQALNLEEKENPNHLWHSPNHILHLLFPLVAADDKNDIAWNSDNTCKSTYALKAFFGLLTNEQKQHAGIPPDSKHIYAELQEYIAILQRDITKLQPHNSHPEVKEKIRINLSLIKQATDYYRVLHRMRSEAIYQQYFNDLIGAIPLYPEPFKKVLDQPSCNFYTLLVKPPKNEDEFLRLSHLKKPIFTVARDKLASPYCNGSRTGAYAKFYGKFNDFFANKTLTTNTGQKKQTKTELFIQKASKNITLPIYTNNLNWKEFSSLLTQAAESLVTQDSNLKQAFNQANIQRGLESYETSMGQSIDNAEEFTYLIKFILDDNFDIKFNNSQFDELKSFDREEVHDLNLNTQIFLGLITAHANASNLTTQDFGLLLDNNAPEVNALAQAIYNAYLNNQTIEAEIFKFINAHQRFFGMSQPFDSAAIQDISNEFNFILASLKAAKEKDEIAVLLPKPNNSTAFYYNHAVRIDLIDLLQTRELNSLYDSKFDAAKQELRTLPTFLPRRELYKSQIETKLTPEELLQTIHNKDQHLLQKLLSKIDDQYVFETFGRDFFKQYDNQPDVQEYFRTIRANIDDPRLFQQFTKVVLSGQARLTLSVDEAKALYVAVVKRSNLPRNRVLQSTSPEAMKQLIDDLFSFTGQAEVESLKNLEKNFSVSTAPNGQLIIEAPQAMLDALEKVISNHKGSEHISMDMAASFYKEIEERYGPDSKEAIELNQANNNDPNRPGYPAKFLMALNLLGYKLSQENIHYNNTINDLQYDSQKVFANLTDEHFITLRDAIKISLLKEADPNNYANIAFSSDEINKLKNALIPTYQDLANKLVPSSLSIKNLSSTEFKDLEIAINNIQTTLLKKAGVSHSSDHYYPNVAFTSAEVKKLKDSINQTTYEFVLSQFVVDRSSNKKGGGGFVIDQLAKKDIDSMLEIHGYQKNRFRLRNIVEKALRQKAKDLDYEKISFLYCAGSARLEAILTLLNINYHSIQYDKNNNEPIIILDEKEQHKIRRIALDTEPDKEALRKAGVLSNPEIISTTDDYAKNGYSGARIPLQPAENMKEVVIARLKTRSGIYPLIEHSNGTLVNHYAELTIDPVQASYIYTAVLDRMNFKGKEIKTKTLKYSTPTDLDKLLRDLCRLGEQGNPYSQNYQSIRHFNVTQRENGLIRIQAPQQAIDILKTICETYQGIKHLSMGEEAPSIYKEVGLLYGYESTEYNEMQKLNNNVLGDPKAYKLKRAFDLLKARRVFKNEVTLDNIRYNSTLNSLAYKTEENQNDPTEKKGNFGFIAQLDRDQVKAIEEITERQVYKMPLNTQMEWAMIGLVTSKYQDTHPVTLYFNQFPEEAPNETPDVYNQRCNDLRIEKMKVVLDFLDLPYKSIGLDKHAQALIIETDLETQSKLKVVFKHGAYWNRCYPFAAIQNHTDLRTVQNLLSNHAEVAQLTLETCKKYTCHPSIAKRYQQTIQISNLELSKQIQVETTWSDIARETLISPEYLIFNPIDQENTKNYEPTLTKTALKINNETKLQSFLSEIKHRRYTGPAYPKIFTTSLGSASTWPESVPPTFQKVPSVPMPSAPVLSSAGPIRLDDNNSIGHSDLRTQERNLGGGQPPRSDGLFAERGLLPEDHRSSANQNNHHQPNAQVPPIQTDPSQNNTMPSPAAGSQSISSSSSTDQHHQPPSAYWTIKFLASPPIRKFFVHPGTRTVFLILMMAGLASAIIACGALVPSGLSPTAAGLSNAAKAAAHALKMSATAFGVTSAAVTVIGGLFFGAGQKEGQTQQNKNNQNNHGGYSNLPSQS